MENEENLNFKVKKIFKYIVCCVGGAVVFSGLSLMLIPEEASKKTIGDLGELISKIEKNLKSIRLIVKTRNRTLTYQNKTGEEYKITIGSDEKELVLRDGEKVYIDCLNIGADVFDGKKTVRFYYDRSCANMVEVLIAYEVLMMALVSEDKNWREQFKRDIASIIPARGKAAETGDLSQAFSKTGLQVGYYQGESGITIDFKNK